MRPRTATRARSSRCRSLDRGWMSSSASWRPTRRSRAGIGCLCCGFMKTLRLWAMAAASFYRRQRPAPGHQQPRPTPARALRASERAHVLDVLASPRFVDRSPAEVVATLLDEGRYLCAERTMYRILAANQPVRERRNQRSHPCYTKPELVATGPNQTWSWDITRLRGPKRWTSFYLYVLLDSTSSAATSWAGWLPIGRTPRSPRR